jgi:hypothetical protein
VLADWRTADVPAPVRAALGFIETLVRAPGEITRADIDALRAAGLSDDAIEDAATVCALFTTYVRLADTFRFAIPAEQGFAQGARQLLSLTGYRFPPPIVWLARRDGSM